nr:uncharacterized protein LOC110561399 [Meriones unguiculatus]
MKKLTHDWQDIVLITDFQALTPKMFIQQICFEETCGVVFVSQIPKSWNISSTTKQQSFHTHYAYVQTLAKIITEAQLRGKEKQNYFLKPVSILPILNPSELICMSGCLWNQAGGLACRSARPRISGWIWNLAASSKLRRRLFGHRPERQHTSCTFGLRAPQPRAPASHLRTRLLSSERHERDPEKSTRRSGIRGQSAPSGTDPQFLQPFMNPTQKLEVFLHPGAGPEQFQ